MHYVKRFVFKLHSSINRDLLRAPPELLSTTVDKQILYKRANKAFDTFCRSSVLQAWPSKYPAYLLFCNVTAIWNVSKCGGEKRTRMTSVTSYKLKALLTSSHSSANHWYCTQAGSRQCLLPAGRVSRLHTASLTWPRPFSWQEMSLCWIPTPQDTEH